MSGPITRQEKELVDQWKARVSEIREAVEQLRAVLEHKEDPEERVDIEKHIKIGERMLLSRNSAERFLEGVFSSSG
ncbi:hypothetical protein [Maritimibacter sp. 55A14]|uniref:hypothetical protein n=1 Tax=Maritimibacter sp. 55A14 TaxID=2174844 RepID=UPI0011B204B8|nr:hypothetical protein [Maritimibacter sp. 55A14]